MSGRSDDRGVKRRRTFDDRSADALVAGRAVPGEPELSAFVVELGAQVAPVAPNAALMAMLDAGLPASSVPQTVVFPPRPSRLAQAVSWRGALPLQLSLAAAAGLVFTVTAASGDLPAPVQSTVADVVEALTPLTVPRPAAPAPVPTISPTPTATPEEHPTARPTRTPDDDQTEAPDVRPSTDGQDRTGQESGSPTTEPRDHQQTPEGTDGHLRSSSSPTRDDQPEPSHSSDSGSGGSGSDGHHSDGGGGTPEG